MTEDTGQASQPDPREEKFVVDVELLSDDQLDGLVDEYCTRYHGLNDTENPMAERERVKSAVRRRELVVWFDPVENAASLGVPGKSL